MGDFTTEVKGITYCGFVKEDTTKERSTTKQQMYSKAQTIKPDHHQ